jgi:hypothetical protein
MTACLKANMKTPEQYGKAAARCAAAPPNYYEIRAVVPAEFAPWEEFAKQSLQATLFHGPFWLKAANLPFKLFDCFRGTELQFRFPPEFSGLRPFIWEGFRAAVRYTYKQAICDHSQHQSIQHWRSPNPG